MSNTVGNTADLDLLNFALISETQSSPGTNLEVVAVPGLRKGAYFASMRNISEYRLSWVNLPGNKFGLNNIGAVILHPRGLESPQNLITCTLAAGWGSSSLHSDIQEPSQFYSTITGQLSSSNVETVTFSGQALSIPEFTNILGNTFPQRRVTIALDWAELLNPIVVTPGGGNTTAINLYLATSSSGFNDIEIAKIMNLMLTAGISRISVELA